MANVGKGIKAAAIGIAVNLSLALIKIITGILGNSYALIADGIESSADIVSSIIVGTSLHFSSRPADKEHPYGHGKIESLAGLVVALALLAAATIIGIQSIGEIRTPHHAPGWFTLPVLVIVIVVKWLLSRAVLDTATQLNSTALRGDAWHHLSDAVTSAAAFVGISVALIAEWRGVKGYEPADDWGALVACVVIAYNGINLVFASVGELIDTAPPEEFRRKVAAAARLVPGVVQIEKVRIRKYGLGYIADVHAEVDPMITVRAGHAIAHAIKNTLLASELKIVDALIHIEPAGEPHEPAP